MLSADLNGWTCPHLRELNLQIFLMSRAADGCKQPDQMESCGTERANSLSFCSPSAVLSTLPERYDGICLLRILSLPNLIRAVEFSFILHLQTSMTIEGAKTLQDNSVHLTWTAQVLYRSPIPTQTRCVTDTTQGTSHRFGAFGQWRNPTTAVM